MARTQLAAVEASSVKSLERLLRGLPAGITQETRFVVGQELIQFKKVMSERSTTGNPLQKQTGRLGGSWGFEISGNTLKDFRAISFSFDRKATKHEVGGTLNEQYPQSSPPHHQASQLPTIFRILHPHLQLLEIDLESVHEQFRP